MLLQLNPGISGQKQQLKGGMIMDKPLTFTLVRPSQEVLDAAWEEFKKKAWDKTVEVTWEKCLKDKEAKVGAAIEEKGDRQ